MRPGDFTWVSLDAIREAGGAITAGGCTTRGWSSPRPCWLVLAGDGLEVFAVCSASPHDNDTLLTSTHLRRGPSGWPRRACYASAERLALVPPGLMQHNDCGARVIAPPADIVAAASFLLCLARALDDPYAAAIAYREHIAWRTSEEAKWRLEDMLASPVPSPPPWPEDLTIIDDEGGEPEIHP